MYFFQEKETFFDIWVKSPIRHFFQIKLIHFLRITLLGRWEVTLFLVFQLFIKIFDDFKIVWGWFVRRIYFFRGWFIVSIIFSGTAAMSIMNRLASTLTEFFIFNFQLFIFFVFSAQLSFQISDFRLFGFEFFLMFLYLLGQFLDLAVAIFHWRNTLFFSGDFG